MASPTPNRGMTYPAHGGAVNSWDTPLNADFDNLDLAFGTYPITIVSTASTATYNSSGATISATVATVTLPTSNAWNFHYPFTGTITRNVTIVFPAVGGFYDIYNGSSGAFTLSAITAAAGSTGVAIGQGGRTFIVADSTNVYAADTNTIANLYTYPGNPTGNVASNAPTTAGSATNTIWDATNKQYYAATNTAVSTSATYMVIGPVLPAPQGYLTPTTGVPVVPASVTTATLYYTPFVGNWVPLSNGTAFRPAQFSELSAGAAALSANNIYDVFVTGDSTTATVVMGFGPSWTVGGGSITAGSGSRGSGAGSTQLTRVNGFWTNTVSITLSNGANTYTAAAGAAIWVGSVYTASAGAITATRAYGQNRVWGVSNGYNKTPVIMKAGDPTSSWAYAVATARPSNNSSGNSITTFSAMADEIYDIGFAQKFNNPVGAAGAEAYSQIGWNSTNSFSGMRQTNLYNTGASGLVTGFPARYIAAPSAGINVAMALELGNTNSVTYYGTETNMLLTAQWRA